MNGNIPPAGFPGGAGLVGCWAAPALKLNIGVVLFVGGAAGFAAKLNPPGLGAAIDAVVEAAEPKLNPLGAAGAGDWNNIK